MSTDTHPLKGCLGIRFGKGAISVFTGTRNGEPAVFLREANPPGVVGQRVSLTDAEVHPIRVVLIFPTAEQAEAVADALVGQQPANEGALMTDARNTLDTIAAVERACEALHGSDWPRMRGPRRDEARKRMASLLVASDDTAQQPAAVDGLTASEAVYAFAAWVTTLPRVLPVGSTADIAPVAELVSQFCSAQGFADPRDDYHTRIKPFAVQQPAAVDGADDSLTAAYMAGRHDGKKSAQQPADDAHPPSAPVGVEGLDTAVWNEVLELPDGFRVAEHLPGIWEYQFDIEDEADEDSDRKVSGTSWNHPVLAAIAAWSHAYDALSQQPAAEEGTVAMRKSTLRYCIRELNSARHGDSPQMLAAVVHGVLTSALADQQARGST